MPRLAAVVAIVAAMMLLLAETTSAEWVEIPQFSDRDKVYRMPPLKFFQQQQQQQQSEQQHAFDDDPVEEGKKFYKISFQKDTSLRNVSTFSNNRRPSFPEEALPDATLASFTTERIVSTVSVEDDDDDAAVELDEFEGGGQMSQFDKPPPPPPSADDADGEYEATLNSAETITKDSYSQSTSEAPRYQNETSDDDDDDDDDKGFLDYLPIDLLKRVHKTLKSQPANLKGKIRFLKMFERTLLEEIESRLSLALAPSRVPRGARGHDEHDEGLGFPSLEGTLMAISFLTFAVYLVRLVMMLFRSANNGAAAPIFIGRKRRSVDDFSEETARILSYLDTPLPRQY